MQSLPQDPEPQHSESRTTSPEPSHAGPPLDERTRWNAKFLSGEAQSLQPDPLIEEATTSLPPGAALDLAGGAGRHALWLAQRGWRVTLTDVSDEGLAIAEKRAAAAGLHLTLRCESAADTIAWATAHDQDFDLIIVCWVLLREHFPALPRLLTRGGRLVYKTYTAGHPRFCEGHSLRYALDPGELRSAFPALPTTLYRESEGVAELIARAAG
jgi:SAM-dependent methyltransferase